MKSLEELINKDEPGWALVSEWISSASNQVEILSRNKKRAESTLLQTQVTTRSPLGAVIYETGGILVNHGWLRILGSGSKKLKRSIADWNYGNTYAFLGAQPAIVLVADDVVGGFFAINGGALGSDVGNIYYFAPDMLEWESLDVGYSAFLNWAFSGDLEEFYGSLRWSRWEEESEKLHGDAAFSFFPFLWTEYEDIDELSRKVVPIDEIWSLHQDLAEQLNH